MRFEPFYQYTNRWHQVYVSDQHDRDQLVRWCSDQQSANGFHVCMEDRIPYRKIEHKHGYRFRFRFESEEDAIMFALVWCEEDA